MIKPISDEDLRQLKQKIAVAKSLKDSGLHGEVEFALSVQEAILARLESAESTLRSIVNHERGCKPPCRGPRNMAAMHFSGLKDPLLRAFEEDNIVKGDA